MFNALPKKIPDVLDIFLPFFMAVMEFMLFAVLSPSLTNHTSTRSIITVWFGCLGAFSLLAALTVTRIRWIFQHGRYEERLHRPVEDVVKLMGQDRCGAGLCSLIGVTGAAVFKSVNAVPLNWVYIFALVIAICFGIGFRSHSKQRKILESELAALSSSANHTNQLQTEDTVPLAPLWLDLQSSTEAVDLELKYVTDRMSPRLDSTASIDQQDSPNR
jgi:hypothetical protein